MFVSLSKEPLLLDSMTQLESLFQQLTLEKPNRITELSASGSNRKYYRISSNSSTLIGVYGNSIDENNSFIALSNHFLKLGLPVPQVLASSVDNQFYLQNDLGDTLLFDYISEGRKTGTFSEAEIEMLAKTIRKLAAIQVNGANELDFSVCYPQPEFNKRSVFWDLNYFKYNFLKTTGVDFQENKLEDDFDKMAEILLASDSNTFMYRDFQTRNVMIKDNEPYFIDFQGGRRGPLAYDVASFLWQAKAQFGNELREELLQTYLDTLKEFTAIDEFNFRNQLNHFVLFRTLQVLGAYGFRGYFEKKTHFLQSIPFAIENLKQLLITDFPEYPYLVDVLKQITAFEQFNPKPKVRKSLLVNVFSFSYRVGIPTDTSDNGGGFVFDCRAIHNPGKYTQYASLTGLDESVQTFLENDGEIIPFLENAYELVDNSVKRYLERGFNNLMVSFGCTGGQHRSVYSAQKMAEHIYAKFAVEVELIHREQNIKSNFSVS